MRGRNHSHAQQQADMGCPAVFDGGCEAQRAGPSDLIAHAKASKPRQPRQPDRAPAPRHLSPRAAQMRAPAQPLLLAGRALRLTPAPSVPISVSVSTISIQASTRSDGELHASAMPWQK